ncbi:MAG: outer membrane lipoprotein carrier protein LolA [Planctomycetota bacterium]|nr:outer membrane lipoprotein carrier protein LolA [Planctomycetota bacterium]
MSARREVFAILVATIVATSTLISRLVAADAPAPATQPIAIKNSSSIDDILDALDARGKNLQDFSADVKLSNTDAASGDVTSSSGKVIFQHLPDGNARLRVSFDKKQVGNKIFPENHDYTLDGAWLVERDYQAKKEVRRQVLKPGQKLDLLKLGEGPFPLPIGQSKEDVKKLFEVKKVDAAKDDPAGTVHLLLTPKPDTAYAHKFKTIDIWVALDGAMPARIETLDANGTVDKVTDLSNVKINAGLGDKDFTQAPLPSDGWEQINEPYGEQ